VLRKLLGALAPLLLTIPLSAGDLTFNLTAGESPLDSPPGGFYQPGLCQNSDGSGSCVIFTGTITTGGDESQDYFLDALYLTMDISNPDGGGVDVLDNTYGSGSSGNYFFLTATPGYLGPDAGQYSYSGDIFEVDVEPAAPAGDYFGIATLDYTDESDCQDPANPCTVSTNFEVVVPEPGAFLLALTGLITLAILRRMLAAKPASRR
jgi:hypothetical protein